MKIFQISFSVTYVAFKQLAQSDNSRDSEKWVYIGIFSAISLLVALLMILLLQKQIKIAIEVIKEGSRSVLLIILVSTGQNILTEHIDFLGPSVQYNQLFSFQFIQRFSKLEFAFLHVLLVYS